MQWDVIKIYYRVCRTMLSLILRAFQFYGSEYRNEVVCLSDCWQYNIRGLRGFMLPHIGVDWPLLVNRSILHREAAQILQQEAQLLLWQPIVLPIRRTV